MMTPRHLLVVFVFIWVCALGSVLAQEAESVASGPLQVGIREVPPFAMQDSAGNWEGLSVDLWQEVADKLNLEFEWVDLSLQDTLTALENQEIDVGVAALTITPEREQKLDFSHPYFVSGLAPAYQSSQHRAWLQTMRSFLSVEFLSTIASLAALLLAVGLAVWFFERRVNAEEFSHSAKGLGDGFWWSAVTMTTVGYGDKAPKSIGGRVVALFWMFASLILIATFTASIAASLTTNKLESTLLQERDLPELKVGVVADSSAHEFARNQGSVPTTFDSLEEALDALLEESVEVVIHDRPILQYLAREEFDDLQVATRTLVRDDYSFALADQSALRESINMALLSILHEPVWQEIQKRYLGESDQ